MKQLLTKFFLILACVCAYFFLLAQSALASDFRAIKLARFFHRYNSPLEDYSETFVAEADKNQLDYRLLPAISGVESTFAKNYIPGSYNAYGWGGGVIYFKSWDEGIAQISQGLKTNYVDRGASDVEKISWIYCPPGNLSWAAKVRHFMEQIEQTDVSVAQTSPINQLSLTI